MTLVTFCGASMLLLVGAMSSSMAMGNALATLVLAFSSLFNGFFVVNVPVYYAWIPAINFSTFGVKAATTNELAGLQYTCSPTDAGCTGNGSDALASLGFQDVDVSRMCVLLVVEAAIMRLLAFFCLHFLHTGQTARERLAQLVQS